MNKIKRRFHISKQGFYYPSGGYGDINAVTDFKSEAFEYVAKQTLEEITNTIQRQFMYEDRPDSEIVDFVENEIDLDKLMYFNVYIYDTNTHEVYVLHSEHIEKYVELLKSNNMELNRDIINETMSYIQKDREDNSLERIIDLDNME